MVELHLHVVALPVVVEEEITHSRAIKEMDIGRRGEGFLTILELLVPIFMESLPLLGFSLTVYLAKTHHVWRSNRRCCCIPTHNCITATTQ